jgi:hypothetical protein
VLYCIPLLEPPLILETREAILRPVLRDIFISFVGTILPAASLGCDDEGKRRISELFDAPIVEIYQSEASFDFLNECVDGAPALQTQIKADNASGSFPDGINWTSEGNLIEPVLVEPLGGNEYCVTFSFDPPVPLHSYVHFGALIGPSYGEFSLKDAVFLSEIPAQSRFDAGESTACNQPTPCAREPGPALIIGEDLTMGLVLKVFNAAGPSAGPVTVQILQWTSSSVKLDSANLVWGDSLLESLPWTDPGSNLPALLYPGQPPLVFDIPDAALLQAPAMLVRTQATAGILETRGIFQAHTDLTVGIRQSTWGRIKSLNQ